MRLSDTIEDFIKMLLSQEEREVELKRNELAEYFGCAPSQINYVLATRFTPDHGYVIESRRGGGGYIRIVRVMEQPGQSLLQMVLQRIGESITEAECVRLLQQLTERQALQEEAAALIRAAVSAQALSGPSPDAMKNVRRARTMKCMLTAVARQQAERK